ncbi:MAG: hypothetical protein JNM07_13495 [Phycisphaerae bacterium]|nr:hypothetical protein [Phycisphaerae bacterium]
MSCNCGCHDDARPATRWRQFVPFLIIAALLTALIAGAVAKKRAPGNTDESVGTAREVGP